MPTQECLNRLERHEQELKNVVKTVTEHNVKIENLDDKVGSIDVSVIKCFEAITGLREDFKVYAASNNTLMESTMTFVKVTVGLIAGASIIVGATWALLTHFHIHF